jgi:hypothetical protein
VVRNRLSACGVGLFDALPFLHLTSGFSMMNHPSDKDILLFRQKDSGRESTEIRAHLDSCKDCSARLAAEERFDREVSERLPREPAPPALLTLIQAGIGRETAEQEASRSRLWSRVATGALAAILVAGMAIVVLWDGSAQAVPGASQGENLAAEETRSIRGQLVCVGCSRAGLDIAHQRTCRGDGEQHVTGMRTPDGNLWRFMDGELIREYINEPQLRGVWLQVDARPYPAIGYLQIAAVARL